MPKTTTAYTDAKGNLYKDVESATMSDITALFGNLEGMAPGIARIVFDKRKEIERIYKEFDQVSHIKEIGHG